MPRATPELHRLALQIAVKKDRENITQGDWQIVASALSCCGPELAEWLALAAFARPDGEPSGDIPFNETPDTLRRERATHAELLKARDEEIMRLRAALDAAIKSRGLPQCLGCNATGYTEFGTECRGCNAYEQRYKEARQ